MTQEAGKSKEQPIYRELALDFMMECKSAILPSDGYQLIGQLFDAWIAKNEYQKKKLAEYAQSREQQWVREFQRCPVCDNKGQVYLPCSVAGYPSPTMTYPETCSTCKGTMIIERPESTPTPESRWPTEEEIKRAVLENCYDEKDPASEVYEFYFRMGIQWLQTSAGTGEWERIETLRADRNNYHDLWLKVFASEKELRECLGECIELCDYIVKSIGYECVETTEIKSLVTKAKSLLSKTI